MSRAKVSEVSSPISLFPFIGILLCTMGALLVILVAVSRSARESAHEQVQSRRETGDSVSREINAKLEHVYQYVSTLQSARDQAERKLRDDQSHLGQIEAHIRQLQERLRSLQVAAVELETLKEEHYDDRQQAEREIHRLEQLIVEAQAAAEAARQKAAGARRSYAVVPYEGPNGTFRRPIYIECRATEVILQPEGVRITKDDLRPPLGPGNPLAAALRAARDYIIRLHPGEGQSRDTMPYPLLLVRADGLVTYHRARNAIQEGDFDFGFELVENDWQLKYPAADVQLAALEQEAVDHARTRQAVVAAAAPRVFRHPALAAAGRFEPDDSPGVHFDDGTERYSSEGEGNGAAGGFGSGGSGHAPAGGSGGNLSGGGNGAAQGESNQLARGPGASSGSGSPSKRGGSATDSAGAANGAAGAAPSGALASGGGMTADPGRASPPPAAPAERPPWADDSQINFSAMTGAPPEALDDSGARVGDTAPRGNRPVESAANSRGQDWALRRRPPRSVPIRRTIRVVIRQDRLDILPESPSAGGQRARASSIAMKGDTVEALDDFVSEVRTHVDDWGFAGAGLYWRPVLVLSVDQDARSRAEDLMRLLENSGLELKTSETAMNASGKTK